MSMSFNEIAEALDVTPATARMHYSNGIKKIRKALQDDRAGGEMMRDFLEISLAPENNVPLPEEYYEMLEEERYVSDVTSGVTDADLDDIIAWCEENGIDL